MIIPHLTKYKCQSCDKWHRLTFRQWWNILNTVADYHSAHWNASGSFETGKERTRKKFNIEYKDTWIEKVIKKLF